jgi:hypothetical protein
MSERRNKYLDMLKAEFPETRLGGALSKLPKPGFDSFGSSHVRPISDFSPPLDAEGVPCGSCPSCGQGEFWRWPKSHPQHNPRGWACWFCSPPPKDSGPCDFCGVPDQMLKRD